jgi:hypothetical protein
MVEAGEEGERPRHLRPPPEASRLPRALFGSRGHRRWWPVLTFLLVVAIGISLLFPGARHQWAVSILRQPTRYTVLYFDHPASLPHEARVSQTVRFSFTIVNDEGHPVDYRYVVGNVVGTGDPTEREVSTTRISARGARSISVSLRPACAASPCRIQVSLAGYPETIAFLVAPPTATDGSNA